MNFLSRMKFPMKLGLMSAASIAGLGIFAALAFATLQAVRINSPMYLNIALGYQLAGDCYDPPASLVAALPPAIEAEDATTPEGTARAVAQLRQEHQAFLQAQKHYSDVLPPGAIRDLMRSEADPSGEEWFVVAEQEFIPALLAGNHDEARKIRIAKMDPVFARHKAANDKLSELTANWIPDQEKEAARIVGERKIELAIIFALLGATLLLFGLAISRSIVKPIHSAIEVMTAIAEGDLSCQFEVKSADEMHEMADALNRTIASFRNTLSAISEAAGRTASASAELTATAQDTSDLSQENARETQ